MQGSLQFEIPITPVGQMRARHAVRKARGGAAYTATFKHSKQEKRELFLSELLQKHVPERPFSGPVVLAFDAFLPIPKSKPQWWKEAAAVGHVRPVTKPDLDNIEKHLTDCMTALQFWRDDCQVVSVTKNKMYSENPRWRVTVWEMWQPSSKNEYVAATVPFP